MDNPKSQVRSREWPRFLPLPTTRTLVLAVLGVIPALLWRWEGMAAWDLGLLLLWGLDLAVAPKPGEIRAARHCPQRLSQGTAVEVELRLHSECPGAVRLQLRDQTPAGWEPAPVLEAQMSPRSQTTVRYGATPPRRGAHAFGDLWLRLEGPLGLALRPLEVPAGATVQVYPPLRPHGYADLAAYRRVARNWGLKPSRWREAGREFESLREYVDGDDPRKIHWKATARFDRLIVQQHQSERNQIVMIVVDAGRLMAAVSQGRSKLDHALEAATHLSHTALTGGDRVGLLAFSDEVISYVPPRRARDQLERLMDGMGGLEPALVEPQYERAVLWLQGRLKRRSLVVIFTDLLDEMASEALLTAVALLRPRHLPLCVAIGESEWSQTLNAPPRRVEGVYERAVLHTLMRQRARALGSLTRRGALALDAPPSGLTPATLQQYLEVKRRGLL